MKINMSAQAVTLRLKQVNQLRRTCLALANSNVGKRIREQFSHNKLVQRTSSVAGHKADAADRLGANAVVGVDR